MALSQVDRSLLARIGFFLARDGEVPEAEKLFQGLAASDPAKDGPVVGLALCSIIKGRFEDAISKLDQRLEIGSVIGSALSLYKLVALGMSGRLSEARQLKIEMQEKNWGEAVGLAETLLVDLEKRQPS
ncbi:MAG: hypothetical protein LBU79_06965 [Planctomycetota bacterium]|jgi:tetratricopeptide (TPR) repeat protein|nr:hypothetical protein [Planctomycetota bacterium]